MALKAWALILCLGVNVYLLGAMVLYATVLYPQLGALDRTAFLPAYQAAIARIGAPVVTMELAAVAVTFPLYIARPASAPVWAVHVLVALAVVYLAVTFGWHLPAHRALAAGDNSAAAMGPLERSQWVRTAVQLARAGLLAWLAARAMEQR